MSAVARVLIHREFGRSILPFRPISIPAFMFETKYGEQTGRRHDVAGAGVRRSAQDRRVEPDCKLSTGRSPTAVFCATRRSLFHNLRLICSCSRRASKAPSGWGCLSIERDTPGVTIADEVDLTTDATVARLMLQQCKIPNEQLLGYEYEAGAIIATEQLNIAARCFGYRDALSGGVDRACAQSRDLRPPLGRAPSDSMDARRPVDGDQDLHMADARNRLACAIKSLTYFEEAALAKKRAAKMAFQAADTAIQIHGGYGVCKEFPFEGFYRETRLMRLLYGREEELDRAAGEKFLRQ